MKFINKILDTLKLEPESNLIVLNTRDNIKKLTERLDKKLNDRKIKVMGLHIKSKTDFANLENDEDKEYILLLSYQLYNICKENIDNLLETRENINLLFYGNFEHRNKNIPAEIQYVNRAKGTKYEYMIEEEITELSEKIKRIFGLTKVN